MTPHNPTSEPVASPNPLRDAIAEITRRWRLLVGFPLIAGIGAALATFVIPSRYESVAMFSPAEDLSSSLPGNLQAIAAQFGITAPSTGYSVYYFAQVLDSRAVLGRVANDSLMSDGTRVSVAELLGTADARPDTWTEETIKQLEKAIRTRTDDQSDLVTLTVSTRSPQTSVALAHSILEALDSVTTASIRRGGSAERRFAQAQADSAQEGLRRAEDQLLDFYTANRSLAASPGLQAEEARLRRQIQIRQDLYLGLVNQAEAAKLREVRNTPAVALVQPPVANAEKSWPKASVWAISAAIGVFVLLAGWLYVIRPLLPISAMTRLPRLLQ